MAAIAPGNEACMILLSLYWQLLYSLASNRNKRLKHVGVSIKQLLNLSTRLTMNLQYIVWTQLRIKNQILNSGLTDFKLTSLIKYSYLFTV